MISDGDETDEKGAMWAVPTTATLRNVPESIFQKEKEKEKENKSPHNSIEHAMISSFSNRQ